MFGDSRSISLLEDQGDENGEKQCASCDGKETNGEMRSPIGSYRHDGDEEQIEKSTGKGRQSHHLFTTAEDFFFVPGIENPKHFPLLIAKAVLRRRNHERVTV
ncbi:MAG: hypothetical protein D6690_09125 [Nitrospirae bacterium]|nr:MAG: hypothetical protein D6690_09125 [Nitrospirota bacterium]